jgi:hypothetical protein
MGRMRDMMTAPAEEKQAETFDNEKEEKVSRHRHFGKCTLRWIEQEKQASSRRHRTVTMQWQWKTLSQQRI